MSSEARKKLLSIEKNGVAGNAELTEVRSRLADIAKNGVPKEKTTVTGQSAAPAGSNARTQDSSLAKKREAARELYSAKQDMASAQEKLKKAQAAADQKAQMQESKRLAEAAIAGYEPEVVTRGQWKMQVNDEETAAARAQLNEAFARKKAAQIKSAEAKAELDAKESPLQPVSVPTLEEPKYQGIGNKVAFAQQNKEMLRTMAAAPTDIDSAGLNLEELSRLTYLTEQEAEVYSRYLQNRGEKAAEDYLKLLERTINARISEEEAAKAKAAAKQNKALGVAGDVAMGYLTWTGAYEGARQALQNAATGEYAPIDPNAGGMRFVNVQNAIKEGLLEDMENPVGKKAAEIGLSALENVSRYPLGPLGMAAMTGGAAAQEMNTATRDGATAEQALMKGVIAGAAEYATEKMGMDRFTAALAGQARGQAVKFVLSTMVPEALEEAASEYINRVADNFIMGTASEMENYKKALMEEGMSEQEADRAAKLEFWVKQPLQAGIEGAISGGLVTGAGAVADATVGRYGRGKALIESGADKLLELDRVKSSAIAHENQAERTARLTGKLSAAEARELKRERESSRQAVEKVEKRYWIGAEERAVVRDLLNGSRTAEQIPPGMDEAAVMELYDAKKAGYEAEKRLKENKKSARAAYAAEAEEALHDFDRFKDKKSGLQYARETAERNIDDVVTDKAQAKQIRDWMLTPVHRNEAESTRRKNELRERVRDLGLGRKAQYTVTYQDEKGLNIRRKVSESGLVQLFGEEKITEADLKSCGADVEKIKKARNVFRGIYDELLENANDVLVGNGYDPIEGRRNYFPHFSTEDGIIEKIGRAVGMKLDLRQLPTEIAGRTDTFRPGKTWFGNFLERKGGEVTYDAVEGFDRYIEGIADVIYHTDDIQRLRAAEKELRYQFSEEGIKKQVQEIRAMMEQGEISEEEGNHRVDDLLESGLTKFPNLVTWLREYTDSLANKKSPADRNMEHKMGRGAYTVMKAMEGRVAANMIALNPGSWLTNFIPITQVSGMTDGASLLNAVADTVKSYVADDGFRDKSDFLTNRRGSASLVQTRLEAAADLAGRPMELIDGFSSDVVTRALYYSGVKQGMSEAEAMDYANDMAARVMADRSKGSMPVLFHEKNPISKLLTMFQLEVNNQYSYFFKDIPRQKREEGVGALVMAFAKMFVGAYLYNELYERIVGRRAAFDPIDMVMDAFRSFSEGSPYEALSKTAKNAAEELPFVGGLLGGGRVPIQSALPDVGNVAKSAIGLASGEMNSSKARKNLATELAKPLLYLVPPFGGGAVKKAYEGYKTVAEGGSFGMDSKGQKTLRFPVEEKSLGNYAKAMVFGPYSMERAQEYVDSGFQSLGGKYTKAYEDGLELGIDYDTFRAVYDATRGVESDRDKDGNTISLSKSRNLKKAIDENTKLATRRQKEFLYEVFGVSSKVWEE